MIIFASCRSLKNTELNPASSPLHEKMPALEKVMGNYSNAVVLTNQLEQQVFTYETDENLTNPYGPKFGYISFTEPVNYSLVNSA